ncbi:molybdate ABC transporter substrate-binding protein [Escherichia coli]|nr:molybdate ABC transporter substrate-binding protein [Escherichia coli]
MARKWLNLFTGAALSFAVAGNALADEGKITVFAAASLTNAMQDIATQYKRERRGCGFFFRFVITLARQIEAGAPADLFISADQKWMDYAVDKKAIDTASRQTLLGNSGRCSTESQRAERFHHRQQNQLDFAAEWRSPRGW